MDLFLLAWRWWRPWWWWCNGLSGDSQPASQLNQPHQTSPSLRPKVKAIKALGDKVQAVQGKWTNKKKKEKNQRHQRAFWGYVFHVLVPFFFNRADWLTVWFGWLSLFFFLPFSLCACWLESIILYFLGARLGTLDATMLPHVFLFFR